MWRPLNILLVTRGDIFPADHGAAAKIVRPAMQLAGFGHRVWLASNDRDRYVIFHPDGKSEHAYPEWLGRLREPSVHRLKALVERIGVPADDHFLYSPLFDPNFMLRAAWLARRMPADVVQAEFPGYGGPAFLAGLLGRKMNARTVVVEHNVEFDRIGGSVAGLTSAALTNLRRLELTALALAQEVVVCSPADRERLAAVGVPAHKIRHIPHGVDLENYDFERRTKLRAAARERFGIAAGAFVLVYHGVMNYGPNQEAARLLASEVVPRLRKRGLNPVVVVIGRDPPAIDDPAFVTPGSITDLPHVLPVADVAAVPLLKGGGTRLKILEYFAAGVPCVATPKGAEGISVTHGRQLMLADDWDTFVDEICDLQRHPDLSAALAEAARRFVEGFSWERIARQFEALYLAAPSRAPSEAWSELAGVARRLGPGTHA